MVCLCRMPDYEDRIIPGSKKKVMYPIWMTMRHFLRSLCVSAGRVCSSGCLYRLEHCPHYCSGALKIIIAILERVAITQTLNPHGLSCRAPPEHLRKSKIFLTQRDPTLVSFNPLQEWTDLSPWTSFSCMVKKG